MLKMKPETINRIYKIVEDNFPAKNGKLDKETYIERQIFFNGIRAALSTTELLEGEGWRKDEWISVNVPPKANEVYECYIRDRNEYVFARWVVPVDHREKPYWQDTMSWQVVYSITHYKTKTPPPSE